MPLPVTMADKVPGAVPLRVTSPAAKSVTAAEKTTVKLIGPAVAGSSWPVFWLIVTVNGVTGAE